MAVEQLPPGPVPRATSLSLPPAATARLLGAIASFLVLAYIGTRCLRHPADHLVARAARRLFDLDREMNFPSGFSTLLLLGTALLLAAIVTLERRRGSKDAPYWAVLTVGFSLMTFDESWSLHEKIIGPMRTLLGGDTYGVFYFAWVVPALTLVVGFGVFFLGFLRRLPARTRWSCVTAGGLFVGGAVGMELLSGKYVELHGRETAVYSLLVVLEEGLEMAGVICFIRALLSYLRDQHGTVRMEFRE